MLLKCKVFSCTYISFCHIHLQFCFMIPESQEISYFFYLSKLNTICLSFHTREAENAVILPVCLPTYLLIVNHLSILTFLSPSLFLGVVHNSHSPPPPKWGRASDLRCLVAVTPGHLCPWDCVVYPQIWSLMILDHVWPQDYLSRFLGWTSWSLSSLGAHTS